MKFHGVFLLVPLLSIASCAKPVDMPAVQSSYTTVRPSVASLADVQFAPLTFPSKTEFEIDASSPAFDFGAEGVSHIKAFELPQSSSPYTVAIASEARKYDCNPCRYAFFYQKVMVLDGARKPIATGLVGGPRYKSDIWTGQEKHREIWIDVTPAMSARYIIVYTTRDLIVNGDSHIETVGNGVVSTGSVTLIFEGAPEAVHMAGMPVGSLSVEVRETGR